MILCNRYTSIVSVIVLAMLAPAAFAAPQEGAPKPGEVRAFEGVEFVWIAPGSFDMGSPLSGDKVVELFGGKPEDAKFYKSEGPVHRVTLTKGFWLGKCEVTQDQWEKVMGNNPAKFKKGTNPVEQVSWDDCQEFIGKLNAKGNGAYRLPTEAEWEYACRAGTKTAYSFGDDPALLGKHAWFVGNDVVVSTHPVGQKTPNAWGLHDMLGNVLEWCQDRYGSYESGEAKDPTGSATGNYRVTRGGSWIDQPADCRSAYRNLVDPTHRRNYAGLRLVRVQE